FGDEVKRRVARHGEGFSRVMGEHEHGRVKGWIVAPPPFPRLIRPRAAYWPEHVAAYDPGANVVEALLDELIIYAFRAAGFSEHPPERACLKHPFVQLFAA